MSARKRLCFLYRSSFKGSCQYCACTRLINNKKTKATSSQCCGSSRTEQTGLCSARQTRSLTVSEPGRCRLHCSEFCVSCRRIGSSLRDTWAARTLLSIDKQAGLRGDHDSHQHCFQELKKMMEELHRRSTHISVKCSQRNDKFRPGEENSKLFLV